jgi:hypothetical protein
MRECSFGSSDKLEIKGGNVAGFTFAAKCAHGTANTAFAANPFSAENVFVKATLTRNGRAFPIFADALLPIALESAFYTASFEQLLNIGTIGYQRLLAAAGGVKEIVLQTITIRLHEVINLGPNDVLLLEVQPNANAIDTNTDNATSKFLFDYLEGIGNGFSIPFIRTHSIQASRSSDSIPLGDSIISVKYINTDKAGITSANAVLTSMNMQSDKFNANDSYEELLSKRAQAFQSNADHALRNQCFELASVVTDNYSGMDVSMNNVNLSLLFNSSNVTASKNWIVTRGYHRDLGTAQKAVARHGIHVRSNQNQYR